MTNADTERGWQNVLREIRRHIRTFTVRPYEQPLSPTEEAEQEAWETARDAVLTNLVERNEGDDGGNR